MTVAVVGSLNADLVLEVDRIPAAGETVLSAAITRGPGGKGANQALAAARAGAATAMVGRIGADRSVLSGLERHGVSVREVRQGSGETGVAVVLLTSDGENSIVVAPGANAELSPDEVVESLARLAPVDVVLAQCEISAEAVAAAARSATRFVLNLAPSTPLDDQVLAMADPLIVNAGEATALAVRHGVDPGPDPHEILTAITPLARSVVLTLGPEGALWAAGERHGAETTPPVEVVDTTGAGDAFAGTLAAALARGEDLATAVRAAVGAGSEAVGHLGAQPLG